MALTLARDLKFKSMKGALKRVFGDENIEKDFHFENSCLDAQIKQENVCFTQQPHKQLKGKFNPLTKQGVVSHCAICDSKMHWAKDCKYKKSETANITEFNDEINYNIENLIEEVNIVLMTTDNTKIQTDLNAIIDTACTKTVAGEEWLHNYIKNLDDTLINQVEVYPSKRVFEFGDGHKVTAISSVKIPAQIGETNCFIITEIVKEKIPLLLSKYSLKKADTVLNIKNDTIKMFGQNIPHLKIGQTVSFSLDNENYVVELINRAGKATGKYKSTFNVQYSRPSNNLPNGYVDFDKVKDIKIIDTKGKTEKVCIIDENCFQNAKQQELDNWKFNNVYTEVANSNQPLLNCRWVC